MFQTFLATSIFEDHGKGFPSLALWEAAAEAALIHCECLYLTQALVLVGYVGHRTQSKNRSCAQKLSGTRAGSDHPETNSTSSEAAGNFQKHSLLSLPCLCN